MYVCMYVCIQALAYKETKTHTHTHQNAAYLQHGKADLLDTVSDEVLKHAQDKLDRADELVKKVEALSDLTSDAATQAREDQIRVCMHVCTGVCMHVCVCICM
jgi:hypothetical protein